MQIVMQSPSWLYLLFCIPPPPIMHLFGETTALHKLKSNLVRMN